MLGMACQRLAYGIGRRVPEDHRIGFRQQPFCQPSAGLDEPLTEQRRPVAVRTQSVRIARDQHQVEELGNVQTFQRCLIVDERSGFQSLDVPAERDHREIHFQ